jgi:hypothetical protein
MGIGDGAADCATKGARMSLDPRMTWKLGEALNPPAPIVPDETVRAALRHFSGDVALAAAFLAGRFSPSIIQPKGQPNGT